MTWAIAKMLRNDRRGTAQLLLLSVRPASPARAGRPYHRHWIEAMPDASSEISSRVISALNDDSTPRGFVIELLQSSFGKSAAEAEALTATIERQGRAICGTFPAAIADAVLADARRRIAERGYRFSLAAEAAVGIADGTRQCSFCGRPQAM